MSGINLVDPQQPQFVISAMARVSSTLYRPPSNGGGKKLSTVKSLQ
jgi:hypothetical protein